MQPKTNRLLMLLVGAVIAGCASQTERSSSGGGTQTEYERVGGSSNAVTKEELERRAAAKAATEAPAAQPAPAPAYEPTREAVQYVDHPLPDTPPPNAAAVAAAPREEVADLGPQDDGSESATQEAAVAEESSVGETTEYADSDDDEVEDLGTLDDESESADQEAALAEDGSVGETTEYADSDDDEVEDLGMLDDESESADQEAALAEDSSVGETTEYADSDDDDVEDLGTLDDESESAEQEASAAADSSVGEPAEYADSDRDDEVEDLGTQRDDSGTASFAEEKRAAADNVVGEPKIFPDEPAPKAATPAAPQKTAPAVPKSVTVNFETEPLFNFDKSTIRADQRAKLDELISGLGGTRYDSIIVVGHADRIGKDAYNKKLSERRAAAVKAYLVKKGVPSDKIQTEGRGESESVTGNACNNTRGKALISCLQPDRRVDVSVSATKQSN